MFFSFLSFFLLVPRQESEKGKPEEPEEKGAVRPKLEDTGPLPADLPGKEDEVAVKEKEANVLGKLANDVPEKTPEIGAVGVPKDSANSDAKPEELQMVYELDEIGNSSESPHFECGFSKTLNLWWLKEIAAGLKRHAHNPTALNLPKEVVDSFNSGVAYLGDIPPLSFDGFRTSVRNTPKPKEGEEPDPKRAKKSEEGHEVVDVQVGTVCDIRYIAFNMLSPRRQRRKT